MATERQNELMLADSRAMARFWYARHGTEEVHADTPDGTRRVEPPITGNDVVTAFLRQVVFMIYQQPVAAQEQALKEAHGVLDALYQDAGSRIAVQNRPRLEVLGADGQRPSAARPEILGPGGSPIGKPGA